jgi:hypothetical protein
MCTGRFLSQVLRSSERAATVFVLYSSVRVVDDTPSNLQSYASQGQGQLFVTLYLGYYHYGQMLFWP